MNNIGRVINQIIIHCSATQHADAHIDVHDLRTMHLARGWRDIGYHWVITRAGIIQKGRPLALSGAHAKGANRDSIGICLVGGLNDMGDPTEGLHYFGVEQELALAFLVTETMKAFPTCTKVLGHRDLSPDLNHDGVITPNEWMKACPTFSVEQWLMTLPATVNKMEFSGYQPIMEQ